MKEYRVQFWAEIGHKWLNVNDCSNHYVFTSEDDAERIFSEHQREHPANRYRILVRNVTEWEEMEK